MTRLCVLAALGALAACDTSRARPPVGGDPLHGVRLLEERGCGACHTIPGVRGARGMVASPLTGFARRTFIAGELPNTPDNLVDWIMHPQKLHPKTAMPELGIEAADARDMAAYLYTLDGS